MSMCINLAKEYIFIYRWNIYIYIYIVVIFVNGFFKSWPLHGIGYLRQIEQILQFSEAVICDNQYGEFLFFNYTKKSNTMR